MRGGANTPFWVRLQVLRRRHPYGGLLGAGGVGQWGGNLSLDFSPIHSFHAVVNAVAHIHIKTPRLPKQRFVAGGAAAVAVTGGLFLGIRLRFHHHTPEQAAVCLAFHQPAANQIRGNDLCWAAEEGVGQGWGILSYQPAGRKDQIYQSLFIITPEREVVPIHLSHTTAKFGTQPSIHPRSKRTIQKWKAQGRQIQSAANTREVFQQILKANCQ